MFTICIQAAKSTFSYEFSYEPTSESMASVSFHQMSPNEQRRKLGSDLVLVLISFRDGFRGSFARAVLAFAATFVS